MSNNNYEKTKDIIEDAMLCGTLSRQEFLSFKEIIEILSKEKEFLTNSEKRQIEDALDHLLGIIIYKPINLQIREIFDFFKKAIPCQEEPAINRKIATIERFVSYHLTSIDAIKLLKKMLKRLELTQDFSPSSFELSKHYLKILNKDKKKEVKKQKNKK